MNKLSFDRRNFLTLAGATAVASALPGAALAAPRSDKFSFIFLTDAHIQPELDGIHGTDLAMQRARAIKADFAIQGGDHVFDALGVSKDRASQLFDQYAKTEQDLGLKVHHTLGNHDIFGVLPASGTGPADPDYGKKMYADRFGPTYYSFDQKGVHFIVLDSVQIVDRNCVGRVDDEQIAWLTKDLAALAPSAPVIVATHMPLVTAVAYYADPQPKMTPLFVENGPAVLRVLEGSNILAVLQGHTHVNEQVLWKGVPYITSGAVCGNWWKGPRMGSPEGFTVVTVDKGKVSTRYEASGFQSVAPEKS